MYRIEKDSLGEKQIPAGALYGIHSERARENFPGNSPFPPEWYKSVGTTKLACYNTYRKFRIAAESKLGINLPFLKINDDILDALCASAKEVSEDIHFDQFIIPAIQGGAGTSINMNINEIITNVTLWKLGYKIGDYSVIDPIEQANIYQSTNDVIPTSLKVAVGSFCNIMRMPRPHASTDCMRCSVLTISSLRRSEISSLMMRSIVSPP